MAHMIKTVSVRLHRGASARHDVQKFTLTALAALQWTDNLHEAQTLYRNMYIVVNSKRDTVAIAAARQEIVDAVSRTDSGSVDEDVELEEPSDQDVQDVRTKYSDARTLRDRSPYTAVFRRTVDDVEIADDDNTLPENGCYSLPCFRAIQALIHLFPTWSAVLQTNVERFGNDQRSQPTSAVADIDAEPTCLTNAAVESHLRSVKRVRLAGRLCRRPYQFVAAELQYVNGTVTKTKLPKLTTKRKKEEGCVGKGGGLESKKTTGEVR